MPDSARISHGTNAGYRKHLRTRTVPCGECRQAHAAYGRACRSTGQLFRQVIDLIAGVCREAGMLP